MPCASYVDAACCCVTRDGSIVKISRLDHSKALVKLYRLRQLCCNQPETKTKAPGAGYWRMSQDTDVNESSRLDQLKALTKLYLLIETTLSELLRVKRRQDRARWRVAASFAQREKVLTRQGNCSQHASCRCAPTSTLLRSITVVAVLHVSWLSALLLLLHSNVFIALLRVFSKAPTLHT